MEVNLPESHYLQNDLVVVLSAVVRKSNIPRVRVGAYVVMWVDSDLPPIVETYAGYVSDVRYGELMGIKTIISKCTPEQPINIVGTTSRLLYALDHPLSNKARDRGVHILYEEVKAIIEARPGSVRLFDKGRSILTKEAVNNIGNMALMACKTVIESDEVVVSANPLLPEPVPYSLPKSEMPPPLERKNIDKRKTEKRKQKKAEKKKLKMAEQEEHEKAKQEKQKAKTPDDEHGFGSLVPQQHHSSNEERKVYNLRSSTLVQRESVTVKEENLSREQRRRLKAQRHKEQEMSSDQRLPQISDEGHNEMDPSLANQQSVEHDNVGECRISNVEEQRSDVHRSPIVPQYDGHIEGNPFLFYNRAVTQYGVNLSGVLGVDIDDDLLPQKKRRKVMDKTPEEGQGHSAAAEPKGWFSRLISKFI
ncbi:hypothetical protein BJV82DRAFT_299643 [Fennellomyces sp. T-0311]|nr:hypothetical protein BJV82DRAFT_299643 [Fennellomyces sp. T-0311]